MSLFESDDTLLVPMGLKALVKANRFEAAQIWDRRPMHFANLNRYQTPVPTGFDSVGNANNGNAPDAGVHLFWTLPKGLTKALPLGESLSEAEREARLASPTHAGSATFPFIPNRWLVTRIHQQGDTSDVRCWVLSADSQADSQSGSGSEFLSPNASDAEAVAEPIKIGVKTLLDDWVASNSDGNLNSNGNENSIGDAFLSVLGAGDLTFSAFTPGNDNVLSFYDDLLDSSEQPLTEATLNYCVVGWYANHATDPLNPNNALQSPVCWTAVDDPTQLSELGATQALSINSALGWAIPQNEVPPTHTVVQASIANLAWNPDGIMGTPEGFAEPTDVSTTVKVAVGNSSADAFSALVYDAQINPVFDTTYTPLSHSEGVPLDEGEKSQRAAFNALLVEALQTRSLRLLEKPGGIGQMRERIKQAAYAASKGDLRWEIVTAAVEGSGEDNDDSGALALTKEQRQWLAQINLRQQRFEEAVRVLESMRTQLFDLWFSAKSIRYAKPPLDPDRRSAFDDVKNALLGEGQYSTDAVSNFETEVMEQVQLVASMLAFLPSQAIPTAGNGDVVAISAPAENPLTADQQLKSALTDRFWQQSDPVVLVANAGAVSDAQPAQVLCQLAASLTSANSYLSPDAEAILPPAANALIAQTAALTDTTPAADLPVGSGHWQQPWMPLYLDWLVEYFPTFNPIANSNGQATSLASSDWRFNGQDYQWTGGPMQAASARGSLKENLSATFTGRCHVTPQVSKNIKSQLQAYQEQYADIDLDETLLKNIDQWNVYSQTLSGFNAQMVMRDLQMNAGVASFLKDRAGSNAADAGLGGAMASRGVPAPWRMPEETPSESGDRSACFFPVRAGYWAIRGLRLTDSFGRVSDIMSANRGSAALEIPKMAPILPPALVPQSKVPGSNSASAIDPQSIGLITAAPRINQPARLALRFVSDVNDGVQTGYGDDDNPVGGWLLANHADKSIAVYDRDGELLGALQSFLSSATKQTVQWVAAPATGSAPAAMIGSPDLAASHLNSLVNSVLGRDDNGVAFQDLLATIDESTWTIDPLAGKTDAAPTTLMGYPIALVRANLQLQLKGLANSNRAYEKLLQPGTTNLLNDDGGLLEQFFAVRLGGAELRRDGLIGYYLDSEEPSGGAAESFAQVYAVHRPSDASSDYVVQAGPDNFPTLPPVAPPNNPNANNVTEGAMDSRGSRYLSLLVDPRAAIHASSGILPSVMAEIPDEFVSPALAAMALTYQVGPVMLDQEITRLPVPENANASCHWIQAAGTKVSDWQINGILPADSNAHLHDRPPVIRDGWVQLTPASATQQDA